LIKRTGWVLATNNKPEATKLAKAALEAKTDEFMRLVEEVTSMMARETGKIGNISVKGKFASIKPHGEATIIGDIHGDLESLVHILNDSGFLEESNHRKETVLIFLGDYGDRGQYSAEVYYIVLRLKQQFPERIVLMRGNHEGPEDLLAHPHDMPDQFQQRFGNDGKIAYSCIRKLFSQLYNAVLVENSLTLIHGGFPTKARSIDDFAYAHVKHPKETFLEEMLWNDPEENVAGVVASPRGAGKLFGNQVTTAFLKMLRVNSLIRGHESCDDGFRLNHQERVLTLFSRKGEPYFNKHGAYLKLNLSLKPKNAGELLPFIRQF
jgi:protein phosphatase